MGLLRVPRSPTRAGYSPTKLAHSVAESAAPDIRSAIFAELVPAITTGVEYFGNANYTIGRRGRAYDCPQDSHILKSRAALREVAPSKPLSLVFYGTVNGVLNSWSHLIKFQNSGSVFFFEGSSRRIGFARRGGSNLYSTSEINLNQPVCIIATSEGNGKPAAMYFDGVLVASAASLICDETITTTDTLLAGDRVDSSAATDCEIYAGYYLDTALKPSQVRAISADPFLPYRPRPILVPVQAAVSADPIAPTGIRQPAPQLPTATLTATTTLEPTGIRQAAIIIPQGALIAATTLQPDGIAQLAPQIPQGALTAFTTLAPVGARQPGPRIPQTDVGSGVSLAPVGIRQLAPLVPLGTLTATTTLAPVGIRQPTPRIPQAELPTSALSPIGVRQTAPRIPQAGVTVATTLNPTSIRQPGPRLPQVAFTPITFIPTGVRQPAPKIPSANLTSRSTVSPTGVRQPAPLLPILQLNLEVATEGRINTKVVGIIYVDGSTPGKEPFIVRAGKVSVSFPAITKKS